MTLFNMKQTLIILLLIVSTVGCGKREPTVVLTAKELKTVENYYGFKLPTNIFDIDLKTHSWSSLMEGSETKMVLVRLKMNKDGIDQFLNSFRTRPEIFDHWQEPKNERGWKASRHGGRLKSKVTAMHSEFKPATGAANSEGALRCVIAIDASGGILFLNSTITAHPSP